MKNKITQVLENIGGFNIKIHEELNETFLTFNKSISNKDFGFFLFFSTEKEMLVVNLLYAYDKLYENMEADFYEVINKLNGNCIHGYLGFLKEEKTQIAYKSSYIGDIANLEGNKSFEYFFQVSFDMVDYFHFQLN
jgi:hypothetical protein